MRSPSPSPDVKRLLMMHFDPGQAPEPLIYQSGTVQGKPATTAPGPWTRSLVLTDRCPPSHFDRMAKRWGARPLVERKFVPEPIGLGSRDKPLLDEPTRPRE